MTPRQLDIIYQYLRLYVDRVELVKQAISDLRPVMFEGLPPETASVEEIIEYCKQLDRVPQIGVWRDTKLVEWKYYFHGGGCRLTSPVTGEVIDWDVSKIGSLDKYFFFLWLTSLVDTKQATLSQSQKDDLKKIVFEAFDQLVIQGILVCLNPQYHTHYKFSEES